MGEWRTYDELVAAINANGSVGYGCAALGLYRTLTSINQIPDQASIDGDETACEQASESSNLTPSDVTAIATAAAVQATSAPIPVTIMTGDYSAMIDDQRIAHDSPNDHTLTPQPPDQVPFRRFVFSNGMGGGKLSLAGQYITPTPDGSAIVTTPVLDPGASVDVISRWVLGAGSGAPPDGQRIDGQPAASGVVGGWWFDIVSYNRGSPTAVEFSTLQEQVMSYTPQSSQRADRIASSATTMLATDLELKLNASAGTFAVTIPSTLPAGDYPVLFEVGPLANAPTWTLGSGASVDSSQGSLPAWTVVGQVYTVHSSGNGVFNVD